MTDREFACTLEDIAGGDRQAFRRLYDEYFGLIFSASLAVTQNKSTAEEVTSEFFIRLWGKKLTGFSSEYGGHRRYLAVCAKNLAVNYIKKYGREEIFSPEDEDENNSCEESEEKMSEKVLISEALKKLSEDEREVIHLKFYSGYTVKEISEILHIPFGTAAWRCRNSIKKLKKIIGEVR